jgi:sec-independent protein translocase protein TatB
MFDVSLVELAMISLVALLVLGPEKLPRAARTVGLYVRKAKQSWYSVRADIERELAADELKRSLKSTEAAVRTSAEATRAALPHEARRPDAAPDEPPAA